MKQKNEDVVLNKAFRERLLNHLLRDQFKVIASALCAGGGIIMTIIGLVEYVIR